MPSSARKNKTRTRSRILRRRRPSCARGDTHCVEPGARDVIAPHPPEVVLTILHQGTGRQGDLHSFPTRRSSDLGMAAMTRHLQKPFEMGYQISVPKFLGQSEIAKRAVKGRSEEHTSELQSQSNRVCRLLREKTKPEHGRASSADAARPARAGTPIAWNLVHVT